MKKLSKYFFTIIAAFSLILSSCNDLTEDDSNMSSALQSANLDKNTAYISLSIDSASSTMSERTVVPVIDNYIGFKKFVLTGSKNGSESDSFTRTFETSDNERAYMLLTNALIPLPLISSTDENYSESWTFSLTGYWAGTSSEDATVYFGEKKNVAIKAGGVSPIAMSLSRNSAYNYSSTEKGNIGFDLTFTDETVRKVEASLIPAGGGERTTKEFSVSGKKATISFADVTSGAYTLDFVFYSYVEETHEYIQVGIREEKVYVLPGLNSKLSQTSASDIDVDKTYSITYKHGTSGSTEFSDFGDFKDLSTVSRSFSRFSKITLPTNSDILSNEIFLGWYTDSGFTKKITEINPNTIVADLTLYGKFVSENEMPTVEGVKFSYESGETGPKVGHSVMASPYYTEEGVQKDFLGTIDKWKWYYGDEGNWTEIATEALQLLDSIPFSSTFVIPPECYGKKLKVAAIQKYTITDPDNDGIYEISENVVNGNFDESKAKYCLSGSSVEKGTLILDNLELSYDDTPLLGTKLESKFKIKSGGVKCPTPPGDAWAYGKDKITISYTPSDEIKAPADFSRPVTGIPFTFSVYGYNDLTHEMNVFVNVKALKPADDTVADLVRTDYAAITYGKFGFTSDAVDSDKWEYTLDGANDTPSYKSLDATEHAYSEIGTMRPGVIKIRLKEVGSRDNPGYIAASEATEFTVEDPAGLGTKVLMKDISLSGTAKIGERLTAKASPDVEGQLIVIGEEEGNITWEWKDSADNILKTENATYNTNSTFDISDASLLGKTITVSARYTYLAASGITPVEKTQMTASLGKGQLSSEGLTYTYNNGNAAEAGASLSKEAVSVNGSYKNKIGGTLTPDVSCYTFVQEKVPDASGSVTLKIDISGYEEQTYSLPVTVKPVAPDLSDGKIGDKALLSSDADKIPYGYILFLTESIYKNDIKLFDLQYHLDTGEVLDEAGWKDVKLNKPIDNNGSPFLEGNKVFIRYKGSDITAPSDAKGLDITTNNIGRRVMTVTVTVEADAAISLAVTGSDFTKTIKASNVAAGKTCSWFIDDVAAEASMISSDSSELTVDTSSYAKGRYFIRVESTNEFGENVSATAVMDVQ